jgi:hypothetical protein
MIANIKLGNLGPPLNGDQAIIKAALTQAKAISNPLALLLKPHLSNSKRRPSCVNIIRHLRPPVA